MVLMIFLGSLKATRTDFVFNFYPGTQIFHFFLEYIRTYLLLLNISECPNLK